MNIACEIEIEFKNVKLKGVLKNYFIEVLI